MQLRPTRAAPSLTPYVVIARMPSSCNVCCRGMGLSTVAAARAPPTRQGSLSGMRARSTKRAAAAVVEVPAVVAWAAWTHPSV